MRGLAGYLINLGLLIKQGKRMLKIILINKYCSITNKLKLINTILTKIFLTIFACGICSTALANKCDVDLDQDIDKEDVISIYNDRGDIANGNDDPRDFNENGVIDVLDAKGCKLQCTLPKCVPTVVNSIPEADAGPNQVIELGETVILDGSNSSDPDADVLTFQWSITQAPQNSLLELEDSSSEIISFEPDKQGEYIVSLIVNDGINDSAQDDVSITVNLSDDTNTKYIFAGLSSYTTGWQPWVTDGTEEGTQLLSLINPNGRSISSFTEFLNFNNKTYFMATDNGMNGEFWSSDGTAQSTQKITNLSEFGVNTLFTSSCLASEKIVFNVFRPDFGFTLPHSLSSEGDVEIISETNNISCSNSDNFEDGSTHGALFFTGFSSEIFDTVIKRTDGISIVDVFDTTFLRNGSRITNLNGRIIYFSRDNAIETKLMVANADGSDNEFLKSFVSINSMSSEQTDRRNQMAILNGKLYFNAKDDLHGFSLWVTDGTVDGTQLVKDLDNTQEDTEISLMQVLDGKLLFSATGSASGLWVSDGTTQGTIKISDTKPRSQLDFTFLPSLPETSVGRYFFAGTSDDGNGIELWASDGTSQGTYLVKEINPNGSSDPLKFKDMGEYMLFIAKGNEQEGFELWRTDGTSEGTYLVKDICPEAFCSGALELSE